jgi:hypothetical protein
MLGGRPYCLAGWLRNNGERSGPAVLTRDRQHPVARVFSSRKPCRLAPAAALFLDGHPAQDESFGVHRSCDLLPDSDDNSDRRGHRSGAAARARDGSTGCRDVVSDPAESRVPPAANQVHRRSARRRSAAIRSAPAGTDPRRTIRRAARSGPARFLAPSAARSTPRSACSAAVLNSAALDRDTDSAASRWFSDEGQRVRAAFGRRHTIVTLIRPS